MRHFLVGACGLLLLAGAVGAKPPRESRKLSDAAKAKIDAAGIKVTKPIERQRVGEHYRLWLSFNPTNVNDPLFPDKQGNSRNDDHRFECYGKLQLDATTLWNVSKQDARSSYANVYHRNLPEPLKVDPRRQGYSLNKNPLRPNAGAREFDVFTIDSSSKQNVVHLSLKLYDLDNPTFIDADEGELNGLDRGDDLFGEYNMDLDFSPSKMGEGHYYWFWEGTDDHNNEVGSNLFLYVEHIETLYGSNTPQIDPRMRRPRIIPKTIPGKVPSPGPVTRRGR